MEEYRQPTRKFRDLSGQRFGKLLVQTPLGVKGGQMHFHVRCDCGTERSVAGNHLTSGRQKSCGCIRPQVHHGQSRRDGYKTWSGMIQRCHNPSNKAYADYGGRGITVCDRWRNSCQSFLDDMGPRPSAAHSVDRIDNDGNYEPKNCRWATATEQNRNNRGNRNISWGGKTQTVQEWATELGLKYTTLKRRLDRLSLDDAMRQEHRIERRSITWNGKTMGLAAWARELGIEPKTLYARVVTYRWDLHKAMRGELLK